MQAEANPNSQEENRNIEQRSYRALIVSLFVLLTAVFIGVFRITLAIRDGVPITNMPFVITLSIVGLIGIGLSRQKRPDIVGYLLLVAVNCVALVFVLFYEGVVTALSGAITVIGIFLVTVIISNKRYSRNILLVLSASLFFLLLDQFGTADRIVVTQRYSQLLIMITGTSFLLLAVYIIRNFKNFSVQAKVLIAITAVAVLSVFIISLTVNSVSRRAFLTEVESDLKQIADREALAFGELLLQQIRIMETAALNPQLHEWVIQQNSTYGDMTEAAIQTQLESFDDNWGAAGSEELVASILENDLAFNFFQLQTAFPENVEVFATDKYGGLIASNALTSDFYQADEDWWLNAYADGQGEIFIGNPEIDESTGVLALIISVPIYAQAAEGIQNQEVVGVLRSTVDLNRLNAVLEASEIEIGVDAISIFINETLSIVFTEESVMTEITEDPTKANLVASVAETDDNIERTFIDEVRSLVTISTVRTHEDVPSIVGLNWYVVVSRAETDALANLNELGQITILLSIFTIVLSTVVALIFGRQLTQPIVELTEAARQIEAGDRSARVHVDTTDEIGQLGTAINSMTDELNALLIELERRVASRTQALQIASDVSRELSSILDLNSLVTAVVNQVRDRYNYYHTQIYLWNEDKTNLEMRGGTGVAGKQMLAEKHTIAAGKGLVGLSAQTKEPIFVPRVRDAQLSMGWIPNAHLPNTVSEVAIPILNGDEVIGVLDVQEEKAGKMTDEDIATLQLVASQIGIAIRNAESYSNAQAKAQQETLIAEIGRKIQASVSIETAMQVAVSELGKHMGAKTKIRLGSSEQPSEPPKEEAPSL